MLVVGGVRSDSTSPASPLTCRLHHASYLCGYTSYVAFVEHRSFFENFCRQTFSFYPNFPFKGTGEKITKVGPEMKVLTLNFSILSSRSLLSQSLLRRDDKTLLTSIGNKMSQSLLLTQSVAVLFVHFTIVVHPKATRLTALNTGQ